MRHALEQWANSGSFDLARTSNREAQMAILAEKALKELEIYKDHLKKMEEHYHLHLQILRNE